MRAFERLINGGKAKQVIGLLKKLMRPQSVKVNIKFTKGEPTVCTSLLQVALFVWMKHANQ